MKISLVNNSGGKLKIKLSSKTILYVNYHVDRDDGVWNDGEGGGTPSYSEIIVDDIYMDDTEITDLAFDFQPLMDFIYSKIEDEQN